MHTRSVLTSTQEPLHPSELRAAVAPPILAAAGAVLATVMARLPRGGTSVEAPARSCVLPVYRVLRPAVRCWQRTLPASMGARASPLWHLCGQSLRGLAAATR